MKKTKELKKWNGRSHGSKYQSGHFYIAAYSQKQASEIAGMASGYNRPLDISEIRNYYSNCWGNPMSGIEPSNPCVYYQKHWSDTPKLIYEIK